MTRSGVRLERAAKAAALREEGLTQAEIAERLGISRSYAASLLNDPDGSGDRARKTKYDGECVDCGSRTTAAPAQRCAPCAALHSRLWTEERIIEALREFARRYDRPPSASDLNPGTARARGFHDRAERFYRDGIYPAASLIVGRFGSFNAALAAAGLRAVHPGGYARSGHAGLGRRGHELLDRLNDGPLVLEGHSDDPSYRRDYYSLLNLRRRGLVERDERGVYRLADSGPPRELVS